MENKWWFSCKKLTVLVVENEGIVVRTAPVTGKFVGQPVADLEKWMTKLGSFRKAILTESDTMVAPNKPAKSAPKPAGSAPPQESVFAAMKKNAALAKNMVKAKKVQAVREFDGPDGDYLTELSRVNHYTKDGALGIIFEFRAIEEGDTQGQKMLVFFVFKQTDYRTVQEVQNEFFETLQLMGIDTDCDDDQLTAALNAVIASKASIALRVKTSKKGSKYISVVGVASAAKEVADTEYVEEVVEGETEDVGAVEEEVDEWEEETTEEAEVEEEVVEEVVEEESSPPSAWVGYAMLYRGTEVEVMNADDTTMKVTIKDGVKKLIVPFSALSPPAE